MKNSFISFISLTLLFVGVVGATGTGTVAPTRTSVFEVSKVEIKDDKDMVFTFNQPLAEEPVTLKILKDPEETEVPVSDMIVDDSRLNMEVKLGEALKKDEDYSYIIISALSMNGKKIEQKEDEVQPIELPEDLVVTSTGAENAGGEDALSKAFNEAKVDPSKVDETSTVELNAASAPTNAAATGAVAPANNEANSGALVKDMKKLPKTGPEENMLVVVALLLSGSLVYMMKKRSLKSN